MKKMVTLLITVAMILTMAVPAFADDAVSVAKPSKVQNIKVLKNGYRSLKVTWQADPDATKYQVYRATTKSGKYILKKTTTTTSYSNIGITCGKTYYYKVRAINAKGNGTFSAVKSSKVIPATVKITKVRPPEDYTNRVYWNKVSGATGYQVYRKRTDKTTWSLFKTISSKYAHATDNLLGKKDSSWGYDYSDRSHDWEYKVRAYRTVNGKKVYGYFSKPAKWVPDWTIKQIYEETWKYVEAMAFPVHEVRKELNPKNDSYLWPKADGSVYHWKHIMGWTTDDVWGEEAFVYTNPANGNTEKPLHYEKATPKNMNWGVLWPKKINPYMTHDSIMKDLKESLDYYMAKLSKANPYHWDPNLEEMSGATRFSIYYEKYGNGYQLWQLW